MLALKSRDNIFCENSNCFSVEAMPLTQLANIQQQTDRRCHPSHMRLWLPQMLSPDVLAEKKMQQVKYTIIIVVLTRTQNEQVDEMYVFVIDSS